MLFAHVQQVISCYSIRRHVNVMARSKSIETKIDDAIRTSPEQSKRCLKRIRKQVFCSSCHVQVNVAEKTVAVRIREHVSSAAHTQSLGKGIQPLLDKYIPWLNAVKYHAENFTAISEFILSYKPDSKSAAFDSIRKILSGSKLEQDLFELRKYTAISSDITSLEKHGMTMDRQLAVVSSVKEIIRGTPFEKKLTDSLNKNPDLKSFTSVTAPDVRMRREFCPLVSVEVERSFSKYKSLLRANRQSFLPENIRLFMIINYNKFV